MYVQYSCPLFIGRSIALGLSPSNTACGLTPCIMSAPTFSLLDGPHDSDDHHRRFLCTASFSSRPLTTGYCYAEYRDGVSKGDLETVANSPLGPTELSRERNCR